MGMQVLGATRVDGADGMRPRTRAVLAALAVGRGRSVSPGELADALWGDEPPRSWAKQVQYCIWDVRRTLGAEAVRTVDGGYQLALDDVDADEFERLIDRGQALAATGDADRAASSLGRALAMWRGRPYDELDGWAPARTEAARLEERRRTAEEDLLDAQLAAGDHRDVVAVAERLSAEEPLRERRWAQLALAQYRSGNQADALRSLRRARQTLVDQLGIEPGADLVALERAILDQEPALDHAVGPPMADRCPYQGLTSFDADDADLFFGRDADTEAALERLATVRLLVVAGPSGSGKSSLVRAGVVPALRRRGTTVAVMVPGADPDSALTNALAAAGAGSTVVVDQMEEVFAGHLRPATLQSFAARLAAHATERAPVIVTIRADHLGNLASLAPLTRLVEQGLFVVSPLAGDALRATIEGPAAAAGLRLESGLVDLLVRETEGEPGALPLLSHALAETWARREGRVLTVDGYRATGEIREAVARSAEELWHSLPADQQAGLRALLLRLVVAVPDGEPVRAHLDRRRLDTADRARLLDLLVQARLVTADESSVELAHEAVARAWPRLRGWLDEDAAGQRLMHHLTNAAEEWDRLGRPTSELYRGARLETAVEWRVTHEPDLTELERAFLDESAEAADSERRQLIAQARRQARQNARLKWALAVAAALIVVAATGVLVAVRQRQEANDQRREAAISALVGDSNALRSNRRDLAALLAVEAYRLRPDAAAESALFGTFTDAPGATRILHTDLALDVTVGDGTLLDDGSAVVGDEFGAVHLVDLDTGALESLAALSDQVGWPVWAVAADGRHVIAAWRPNFEPETGRFTVWDLETQEQRFAPVNVPFRIGDVAISDDGATVAVSGGIEMRALTFDAATGEQLAEADRLERPEDAGNSVVTAALRFLPDGRLAVGSQAGVLRLIDPATGHELQRFEGPQESSHAYIAFIEDGAGVVAAGNSIVRYDVDTGAERWRTSAVGGCNSFVAAEAIGALLCGEWSGRVIAYDLATGAELGSRFDSQQGDVCGLAVSPDGTRLLEVTSCQGTGLTLIEWRLDGGGPVSRPVMEATGERFLNHFRGFGGADALVAEIAESEDSPPRAYVFDAEGREQATFDDVWALVPTEDPSVAVVRYDDGENPPTFGLYDTARRAPAGPVIDPGMPVYPDVWTDGRIVITIGEMVQDESESFGDELRTFDLASGRRIEPTVVATRGHYISMVGFADESVYLLRFDFTGERTERFVQRIDRTSGAVLAESERRELYGQLAVGGNRVVVSTRDGLITELDPTTLTPVGAPFPGTNGGVTTIDLDQQGRRLLVRADDDSLRFYDVPTRTQLGGPIDTDVPFANAALRGDGLVAAAATRRGINFYDLDPARWVEAACELAGRNMTREEWDRYIGDLAHFRATCPGHPPG